MLATRHLFDFGNQISTIRLRGFALFSCVCIQALRLCFPQSMDMLRALAHAFARVDEGSPSRPAAYVCHLRHGEGEFPHMPSSSPKSDRWISVETLALWLGMRLHVNNV